MGQCIQIRVEQSTIYTPFINITVTLKIDAQQYGTPTQVSV